MSEQVMFSPRRVAAMVLRYWYLLRSSFARVIELIYWPTVQMLMWGFLQTYLAGQTSLYARAGGVLIGAVMLYYGLTTKKTVYVRNDLLGSLQVTPMTGANGGNGMAVTGRF